MRLWTLSPKYLDTKGLVALWREGLLAKHVLEGKTVGYRNYPQLNRFKAQQESLPLINNYLFEVWQEALNRKYNFDRNKIEPVELDLHIPVTTGQINYELEHLKRKLTQRDQQKLAEIGSIEVPEIFTIFAPTDGDIEPWEIVA